MKKYKICILIFLLFIILTFLFGCSSGDSPTGGSGPVLSSLKAINANKLSATFDNDKNVEITNFNPQPLELGKETKVSFAYDNTTYSGNVTYTIDINGTFNTDTTFLDKILGQKCFAQARDKIEKVILFYGNDYKVVDVTQGNFEIKVDKNAPAGLIFADGNNGYVGYLKINEGLDSLPIKSLSNDIGEINLGKISFTDVEGTSDKTSLLNLNSTEENMLSATDDLFASTVRNPGNLDLDKNGKIDILENKELKTGLRGKIAFYANGGTFNSDLTVDINNNLTITGSKFMVDFYSETYNIPSSITFNCSNDEINGSSADKNIDGNRATYFSKATSGILPSGDYIVDTGDITHTFTVSDILANAENNLIYVVPKINLNNDGTINSIEWQCKNKEGDIIKAPSKLLNSLEIQINATSSTVADKYKDYPQDLRIYNGYPDPNEKEHLLTEDIKWEDVGGISMAYNDVFKNHYVFSFDK